MKKRLAILFDISFFLFYTFFMQNFPKGFFVFGHEIRFYGIISALGYLLGVLVACKNAKKRGLKTDDILTMACYVIPFCIIGARLCYVFTYIERFHSFVDVIAIWNGGLIFYGGLIGGALALVVYCLIHKKNFLALADVLVPALAIGQALGRWGNFFNQEAYGYAVTDPAWQWFPFAVYIEDCHMSGCTCAGYGWHHATFFYESVLNVLIFAVLMILLHCTQIKQNGVLAGLYLVMYGIVRFFIEGMRTDSVPLGNARFSQVLSLIFLGCGLGLLLFFAIKNKFFQKAYKKLFRKQDVVDRMIEIIKKDF